MNQKNRFFNESFSKILTVAHQKNYLPLPASGERDGVRGRCAEDAQKGNPLNKAESSTDKVRSESGPLIPQARDSEASFLSPDDGGEDVVRGLL